MESVFSIPYYPLINVTPIMIPDSIPDAPLMVYKEPPLLNSCLHFFIKLLHPTILNT